MSWDVAKIARPNLIPLKEYVPGKPVEEVKRELGLTDIVKLASNENPLGTSPKAMEAMLRELKENAALYPESLCHDLVVRLAEIHGLKPEQFFVDNGLDGVITMLGLTFIDPGDEVVMGAVTFPAYANITSKMAGKIVSVPMTPDHRQDVEAMARAITPRTKMVFMCNPNNPTGTINTKEEFECLLEAVPETALLVVDEAYYEYADNPHYPQTLPYLENHPNLVILRTFSKAVGMAGLRVGYGMAHPDVIRVMLKSREPFPVNRIAQAGALASLDDTEFIEQSIRVVREGREQWYAFFEEAGIEYCPSQTNFVFADFKQPTGPVFEQMLREGIIVRPLGPQNLPTCMRITIGTREQNERAIEAFRKVLALEPRSYAG